MPPVLPSPLRALPPAPAPLATLAPLALVALALVPLELMRPRRPPRTMAPSPSNHLLQGGKPRNQRSKGLAVPARAVEPVSSANPPLLPT